MKAPAAKPALALGARSGEDAGRIRRGGSSMTEQQPHAAPPSLLRVLGLVFGLAVVVGGMVGSGIMRAPGVVAQGITSPTLILLAWAAGGGVALLSAMPLVEAGSSVPKAGGAYPIAKRAFGPVVGFLTGWLSWLQYVASSAFIAVVFGEYVHRLGFLAPVSNSVLAVRSDSCRRGDQLGGHAVSGLAEPRQRRQGRRLPAAGDHPLRLATRAGGRRTGSIAEQGGVSPASPPSARSSWPSG